MNTAITLAVIVLWYPTVYGVGALVLLTHNWLRRNWPAIWAAYCDHAAYTLDAEQGLLMPYDYWQAIDEYRDRSAR